MPPYQSTWPSALENWNGEMWVWVWAHKTHECLILHVILNIYVQPNERIN